MNVIANNPYSVFKTALEYGFGNFQSGRPVFSHSEEYPGNTLYFKEIENDNILSFRFDQLNYEYVKTLSIEDIPSFTAKEYGKFFYEYGRCLFANLAICLSKADVIISSLNFDKRFVVDYSDELYNLNSRIVSVMESFRSTLSIEDNDVVLDTNYAYDKINNYMTSSLNDTTHNMCNSDIFIISQFALFYTLLGYILLILEKNESDTIELFRNLTKNNMIRILQKIVLDNKFDNKEEFDHVLTMMVSFYMSGSFYKNVSGLEKQDPVYNIIYELCDTILNIVEDKTVFDRLDKEIVGSRTDNKISLSDFTACYNPIVEILAYKKQAIIKNENCNIWKIGREYYRAHIIDFEKEDVSNIYKSPMKLFLKFCEKTNVKIENTSDIDIGVNYLSNILEGLENNSLYSLDPGTILQLTIMASYFRKLEKTKSSKFSVEEKNILLGIIDTIDIIIVSLYDMWFNSSKYYSHNNRFCCKDNNILTVYNSLKEEIVDILSVYFEYVRYGLINITIDLKVPYRKLAIDRYTYITWDGDISKVMKELFKPLEDTDVYIRECANKGITTIAYSALCNKDINVKNSIQQLVYKYSKTEIPKNILKKLSKFDGEYTGNILIDKCISVIKDIKDIILEEPGIYMIAVYIMLYYSIDKVLLENNSNYFDFGKADNSISNFNVDSIVNTRILTPIKKIESFNNI